MALLEAKVHKKDAQKPKKIELASVFTGQIKDRTAILPPKKHVVYCHSDDSVHVFQLADAFVEGLLTACNKRSVELTDKSIFVTI